jgi:hypothetical protein
MTQPLSAILRHPPAEAMELLLASWHGPRAVEPMTSEQAGSTKMPGPLRRFYGILGGWRNVVVQNVVLAPPEMPHLAQEKWATARVDDGKLVFYVENQGVCEWATSLEDTDEAPVWIRGSTLGGELSDWTLEEPPLSVFLLQLLVFEAIMGAPNGASVAWLDRQALAQIVEPLDRLQTGPWRWPSYPGEFYAGDRVLAFAGPNPGPDETESTAENVSLALAALDSDALAYLDDLPHLDWDWFSRRDGPAVR